MLRAETVGQWAGIYLWTFLSVGVSFPETDENSKRPSILERSRDNSIFRKYSVTDDSIVWPILSHNDTGQGISILHVVPSSKNCNMKIFPSEPSLKFKWFNLYGSTSIVSISVKKSNRVYFNNSQLIDDKQKIQREQCWKMFLSWIQGVDPI